MRNDVDWDEPVGEAKVPFDERFVFCSLMAFSLLKMIHLF